MKVILAKMCCGEGDTIDEYYQDMVIREELQEKMYSNAERQRAKELASNEEIYC